MNAMATTLMTERRDNVRQYWKGLVVLIEDRVYPVLDISVSGVSFQASSHSVGSSVKLKLAQLSNLDDCVDGTITVRASSDSITRGEFAANMTLLRYIVGHIGKVSGASPTFFK
jgi:hypothetical protein